MKYDNNNGNVSESIAEDELRSEGGGGSLYCGENPVGTGLPGLGGGDSMENCKCPVMLTQLWWWKRRKPVLLLDVLVREGVFISVSGFL